MKRARIFLKDLFIALPLFLFCFGCSGSPKKGDLNEPVEKRANISETPASNGAAKTDALMTAGADESKPKMEGTLSISEFDKQITYYKNRLKTDPNNPEINFNLASIYLSLKNIKNANYYTLMAIKYAYNKNDKENYKAFYSKLVRDAYRMAKKKRNIDFNEMFLELFPDSNYYEEIRNDLEELMYQSAINKNSKEFYGKFVKLFPSSIHLQSVNDHLDELAFEDALKLNTIKGYQDFIKNNMYSNFKLAALDRIDRLRFEEVRIIDSIVAYSGFIEKYPANKYAGKAKERMNELKFSKIEDGKSIEKFDDFIKSNPQSPFVGISLDKIDELRYEKAKSYDTIAALEEFIKKYPDSKYNDNAVKRLDVLRYEEVEASASVEAYESFLASYPKSRFKYDVEDKLDALKKETKIKKLCDEAEKVAKREDFDEALEFYQDALKVDYSSRAHYGIAKIFEILGDREEDYKDKIEYYYKAGTEYMVITRKDQNYENVSKDYDNLMGKRSLEQDIMNEARTRRQFLPEAFTAELITYSKSPIMIFANTNKNESVSIDVSFEIDGEATKINVAPLSEVRKTFKANIIKLKVNAPSNRNEYSFGLFPYYEYSLRLK